MSSHAAQSPRVTRWRRGHMHFSPAARPLPQAGSPEWSVASEVRRDRRERLEASGERSDPRARAGRPDARGGPYRITGQPGSTLSDSDDILADSERARPSRWPTDPASTTGTRSAREFPCAKRNGSKRDAVAHGRGTSNGRGVSSGMFASIARRCVQHTEAVCSTGQWCTPWLSSDSIPGCSCP